MLVSSRELRETLKALVGDVDRASASAPRRRRPASPGERTRLRARRLSSFARCLAHSRRAQFERLLEAWRRGERASPPFDVPWHGLQADPFGAASPPDLVCTRPPDPASPSLSLSFVPTPPAIAAAPGPPPPPPPQPRHDRRALRRARRARVRA